MKKINRYAILRIPTNIDYERSVNMKKRIKKSKLYRRSHIRNIEIIKNNKLSVICYAVDGKPIISCPLCHKAISLCDIGLGRYSCCKTCGCIYDKESNKALKFYKKYLPKSFHEIEVRRLNNKNNRYRLKEIHQKEQNDRYIKQLYPLITVMNKNGHEIIITKVTKMIQETDWLCNYEKKILARFQMPVERYASLKKLGVNFTTDSSESVGNDKEKYNNYKGGIL